MKARFFSAVLAAMVLATASVGITASAEEAAGEPAEAEVIEENAEETPAEDISERAAEPAEDNSGADGLESYFVYDDNSSVSEESADDMEKFREVMSELAEAGTTDVQPDYYGDPYYDTDGNATLIKSESIIYNTEEMQFIAVTTKDGHVFYVLINYSAADGQDNVYFLNRVDDYDLYALLYAGEEDEDGNAKFTPEEALQAAEAVNGRVKHDDTGTADTAETADSGEDTSEGDEEQAPAAPMNMTSVYLVFGAVVLIGVGAGVFFFKKKKNGSKAAVDNEPDDDSEEEEFVEDEDYEFYDHKDDEE